MHGMPKLMDLTNASTCAQGAMMLGALTNPQNNAANNRMTAPIACALDLVIDVAANIAKVWFITKLNINKMPK